ncbi:unnamed protein product, partial [Discosporangium mesarthrocarpum]
KLPYGSGKDIVQEFEISRTTVFRHFKAYDLQKADGQSLDMSRGRDGRCGRPNAVTDPWECLQSGARRTANGRSNRGSPSPRCGACASGWERGSTNGGSSRCCRTSRSDKVGFALSHVHRKGGTGVVVDGMYDWGHVDEKWFCVMKDGRGIYLYPEEDASKRPRAQNKRFITKVMFPAAVARPRMISDGVWFDGNIGIWPIVDTVAAMGSSKNRKKGTMMLKPATINAERYKELMIDKVI